MIRLASLCCRLAGFPIHASAFNLSFLYCYDYQYETNGKPGPDKEDLAACTRFSLF